jgi:hypothetical protein
VLRAQASSLSPHRYRRQAFFLSRSARFLLGTAIIAGLMLALVLGAVAMVQAVVWTWQQAIVEAMNAGFPVSTDGRREPRHRETFVRAAT